MSAPKLKVGLSWKDIHGEDIEKTSGERETDKETFSPQPVTDSSATVAGSVFPKPSVTLDDDSLFGSSSSGEDSDDEADSESDNEANQAKDVDDLHYKKCLRPQRQLLNKIGDMKT